MRQKLKFLVLIIIPFAIIACSTNKFEVDVSDIEVNINLQRFDRDLFSMSSDSVNYLIPYLKNKYGYFFEFYNQNIVGMGKTTNAAFPDYLKYFLVHKTIVTAHDLVEETYKKTIDIEKELESAFRYYKYYFPKAKLPKIYTCISGFNAPVYYADSILAIALDLYLGADCEVYKNMGIYNYKIEKMHRGRIPVDCMATMLMSQYPYNDSIDNMATNIIYHGRVLYALDAMLPDMPKTIKYGYTSEQLAWAEEYEAKIWEYLKNNELIYSSDQMDIARFINDASFTTTFTNNSAPRTGIFVGRKIVNQYMEKHPELTLKNLMEKTDYVAILLNSSYIPD